MSEKLYSCSLVNFKVLFSISKQIWKMTLKNLKEYKFHLHTWNIEMACSPCAWNLAHSELITSPWALDQAHDEILTSPCAIDLAHSEPPTHLAVSDSLFLIHSLSHSRISPRPARRAAAPPPPDPRPRRPREPPLEPRGRAAACKGKVISLLLVFLYRYSASACSRLVIW